MKIETLISFSSIPIFGVLVQWISWAFRVPAILLLLLLGFLMGPVFGVIDPFALFGDTLYTLISVAVAIILFEGGLSLKFSDLTNTKNVVRNLITVGAILTWILVSFAAYYLLGFNNMESLLLGAILIVSGPTVIIPLLRHIQVSRSVSAILRWEGIMIDPVGATFAVLVYDVIVANSSTNAVGVGMVVIFSTILLGLLLGGVGAWVLTMVFRRHWVPDFLQGPFTLTTVLSMYVLSNLIQAESGLLVVTIMGIIMANQKVVVIKHIMTFKEQLTTLLLSSMFIILAATIEIEQLKSVLTIKTLLFLVLLIGVIRPVMVFVSTYRSTLSVKEKIFLSFIAPRGIVAAAVAALFSTELQSIGYAKAGQLFPITFVVIVVTVTFYGLLGRPLAALLGLNPSRQGTLIVGAQDWARDIAKALVMAGVSVIMVDTDRENCVAAKVEGLQCIHASVLSQRVLEEVETGSVSCLLAMSSNDELNLLASLEYTEHFGESAIYRLCPADQKREFGISYSGQRLFARRMTYSYLSVKKITGYEVKLFSMTDKEVYDNFLATYKNAILLFIVDPKKGLKVISVEFPIAPQIGQRFIAMV